MPDKVFFDPLSAEWQEEGLFARDIDGQLTRLEKARIQDYYRRIHLWIDDQLVVVPKALPRTDSQGNIIKDEDGRTIPRLTTIYDAAVQLFEKGEADEFQADLAFSEKLKQGDVDIPHVGPSDISRSDATQTGQAQKNPIPILCHQQHMNPVGVCRVCSVEIGRPDSPRTEIVPACWHPVADLMEVSTKETSAKVKQHASVLLGLLYDDHQRDIGEVGNGDAAGRSNDLVHLCQSMDLRTGQFTRRNADYDSDKSSPMIHVNHNACILCERCVRGCNEIKNNHVIGRTGKGYAARIAFDLDEKMGYSSCVECGECMISCPTNALTFRRPVESKWWRDAVKKEAKNGNDKAQVSADELKSRELFQNISYKFLEWNQAAIVRRKLNSNQVLCRVGDYGATAFILIKGKFGVWLPERGTITRGEPANKRRPRLWDRLVGRGAAFDGPNDFSSEPSRPYDFEITPKDLILGEMTCMSDHPRTATVKALTDDCEVYEIRRNVLYMLQRDPVANEKLRNVYTRRAIEEYLHQPRNPLFHNLEQDKIQQCLDFLRPRVKLVHVDPGQNIFRQGEEIDAASDVVYLIRIGYVKFWQTYLGQERVLDYFGPGKYFGDIGLMSAAGLLEDAEIPEGLVRKRTANCSALDHVELVRIRGEDFLTILERYPPVKENAVRITRGLLTANKRTREQIGPPLDEFLEQGLYNARKLLVLDLDACTRCDECVKACADTHGGVTRLVREGLHFDRFLVASACRSCSDPYCLVGCPVDAIHREGSFGVTEIRIEDHCIGCGQCAINCPYGNINMHGQIRDVDDPEREGKSMKAFAYRATTCDLCQSNPRIANNSNAEVSCVYACPHNAAFRMSGEELLEKVGQTPPTWSLFEELVKE